MTDPLIFDPEGGLPRLLEIMRRLRDPETGCPWDVEQTFDSIAPYTIEEAYEVADAIARADMADLEAELGDLLLQTVYHAQIGAEAGLFSFDSIASNIGTKMVDRHPHVFGDQSNAKSAAQQTRDWEAQKAAERARRGETRVLDGVAMGLPGMTRAVKLQKRMARVGFDWDATEDVIAKLIEEARELADAKASRDADALEDEFGDILFVMANLARHLGIDPESAIRRTNAKVTRRFNAVEETLETAGERPEDKSLAELDALWDAAKAAEKG